jgi:hypothetical protein
VAGVGYGRTSALLGLGRPDRLCSRAHRQALILDAAPVGIPLERVDGAKSACRASSWSAWPQTRAYLGKGVGCLGLEKGNLPSGNVAIPIGYCIGRGQRHIYLRYTSGDI